MWTYMILGLAGAANVVGLMIAQTLPMKALSTAGIVAAIGAALVVYHRRRC